MKFTLVSFQWPKITSNEWWQRRRLNRATRTLTRALKHPFQSGTMTKSLKGISKEKFELFLE